MRALRNKMLPAYTIGIRTGLIHNDILDVVVLVLLVLWSDKTGLQGWCIAFRHLGARCCVWSAFRFSSAGAMKEQRDVAFVFGV